MRDDMEPHQCKNGVTYERALPQMLFIKRGDNAARRRWHMFQMHGKLKERLDDT